MITVGVLGGGQLGRMLALAGTPLGMRFRFLDPEASPPAHRLGEHVRGDFADPVALARLAEGADVVTYEFDAAPLESLEHLARRVPVRPAPAALGLLQDRLVQKGFLDSLGIPVAAHAAAADPDSLQDAVARLGAPCILKSRRGGYDGRGQVRIERPEEAPAAWHSLGGVPAVLERRISFQREIAILAARDRRARLVLYPLVETRHRDGILVRAIAPAPRSSRALRAQARSIASRVLEALDYVGVLAIECFEVDGRLVVNELAPRVHNSGHWTIEGAATSQFENHLRAISGLPLGAADARGVSGLVNLIGALPDSAVLLSHPSAHLHCYDKEARPGRKVGHVTVRAGSHEQLERRMNDLEQSLSVAVQHTERSSK